MRKKMSNQNDNRLRVLRYVGMMLVLVPLLIGAVSATIWYVDDDGGARINFTQIQEAVDAAQDNDTIYVYSGTYNENLLLNRSLILTGESRNTTIINGRGSGDVINVTADNCVISDFTVRNSGGYDRDAGIKLYNSCYNNISGNAVFSNEHDLYLWNSRNNMIFENTMYLSNGASIALRNSSSNIITKNTVLNNSGTGIYLTQYSSNNAITENTVLDNIGYGIYLTDYSSSNTITENTVLDNGWHGICLTDYSSSNTITENTILDHKAHGIYLTDYSSSNTITENTVLNNIMGIYLFYNNKRNTIVGNNFSNSEYGIFLRDYNDNNIITDNNVFSNKYNGIYILWNCNYNNITGNTVVNNGLNGIYIKDQGDHNIIMNNNISLNKKEGIMLHWHSDRNTITGNTVTNNQNGIIIRYSCDGNTITNNTVSSNNGTGIRLPWVYYWGNSDYNSIYHNNFINNAMQAYDDARTNSWDAGSENGGNYWSDHICIGNPSNGSRPYNISGNGSAQDRFPFMNESGWL